MASIYDLIVRLTGDGQQLRDDIDEDIAKVDELKGDLDSLTDKDVTVKTDTTAAREELKTLKHDVDELKSTSLGVWVNDQQAFDSLAELHFQIEELEKNVMNVNLDDKDADSKLATLGTEAEALRKELDSIKVNVKDGDALTKIAKMDMLLSSIHDKALNISAKVNDTEAKPKLDDLLAKEKQLREAIIKVDVKDEDAKLKVKALKLDLDKLHDKALKVDLRDSGAILKIDELDLQLDGVERRIKKINDTPIKGGGGGNKGGFNWGALIGSALPAASPLAATAGGGLMGLLSAALPGMAGGAGYAAVAGSTLKPVFTDEAALKQAQAQYQAVLANPAATNAQKLQALQQVHMATSNLNSGQMQALGQVQQFGGFMQGFDKGFQPQVLTTMTRGLQLLQNVLKDLSPAIKGFANGLNQLLSDANKALGGPVWKQFFSYLGGNAKSSILAFGTGLGNIAKGFASLMVAFNPLAKSMDAGWTKMTASFAKWAANVGKTKGFQQFLTYVKTEGPQVLKLIGGLGTLAATLLKDMSPVGAVVLKVANAIVTMANDLAKGHPRLVALGFAVLSTITSFKLLKLGIGGIKGAITGMIDGVRSALVFVGLLKAKDDELTAATLASTIAQKAQAIATKAASIAQAAFNAVMDANPITLVILAIAALGAGIVLLVTHWKQVKHWVSEAWNALKSAWSGAGNWFSNIWTTITTDAQTAWNAIGAWFSTTTQGIVNQIEQIWGDIKKWFSGLWQDVQTAASQGWSAISKWLSGNLGAVYGVITNIFAPIIKWFDGLWGGISTSLPKAWKAISTALSTAAKSAVSAITTVFDGIGTYFTNLWTEAEQWGKNLIGSIVKGIESEVSSAVQAVGNVINSIKSAIGLGTTTHAVSQSVSNMVTGGTTVHHVVTGTITHNGKVQSDGLTNKAITQVNQELMRQVQRRVRPL